MYTRARCANYVKLFKYFKIYINGGRGRGFVYVLRIFELIYARAGYLNLCVCMCAGYLNLCVYVYAGYLNLYVYMCVCTCEHVCGRP